MGLVITQEPGSLDLATAHAFEAIGMVTAGACQASCVEPPERIPYQVIIDAMYDATLAYYKLTHNVPDEGLVALRKSLLTAQEFWNVLPDMYKQQPLLFDDLITRIDVDGDHTLHAHGINTKPLLDMVHKSKRLEKIPSMMHYSALLEDSRRHRRQ